MVLQVNLLHDFLFRGKSMDALSLFAPGNYPLQLDAASLIVKSLNVSFLMETNFDVLTDLSSATMSGFFANVEILLGQTFFAFSPFCTFLQMIYIDFRVDNRVVQVLKDENLTFSGN